MNVTISQKYSTNSHACTSFRYQAIPLLPRDLGTKLDMASTQDLLH